MLGIAEAQVTAKLEVDAANPKSLGIVATLPAGSVKNDCYFGWAFTDAANPPILDFASTWMMVTSDKPARHTWTLGYPIKAPRLTWQSCYELGTHVSPPPARIEAIFDNGMLLRGDGGYVKDFAFGKSYEELNQLFTYYFEASYTELPVAREYQSDNIHYVWVPFYSLPIAPGLLPDGKYPQGQHFFSGPGNMVSYVVFAFKNDQLFHISVRLRNYPRANVHDWILRDFFPSKHKLVLDAPGGNKTIIVAHSVGDNIYTNTYFVLDVTRSGVDDDDASIAKLGAGLSLKAIPGSPMAK